MEQGSGPSPLRGADVRPNGFLKIPSRELPWLDRLRDTVEDLPGSESDFIAEMRPTVDSTKYTLPEYAL